MALTKALGGGGGTLTTVKDEGSNLTTAATSLDVVGAGATATNVGGAVTLTVPGAVGSSIRCRARKSTTTAVATGAVTAIALDTEDWDTDTMHSTVTNTSRITVNTAGLYLVTGQFGTTGAVTGTLIVILRLNGTTNLAAQTVPNTGTFSYGEAAETYNLAATDYLELCYFSSNACTLDIGSAGQSLSLTKLA
jgi:hypothetical protein